MEEVILYIDCDGVILNTIEEAFRIMKSMNMNVNDPKEVNRFFININWNFLVYHAGIIDDAIDKIKMIIEKNYFKEVIILTKLSGNPYEEKIKKTFFSTLLPNVKVITLKLNENKDEIVDPINNILIDDSFSNIIRWRNALGIGILFNRNKSNILNDEIDDLNDIIKVKRMKIKELNYGK